jgi:hypothetical protein
MKPLQISTFWLSNALFQLEFIRIVALEKVAGSIPVGDPPKFRIGKFKTIAADALRPNIVLSSAKIGRSTGSVNWISSMSLAESTVASSEYGGSLHTCSMTTSLWSSWCAVDPSVPPPRRCLARWCRRRPSHARAEQASCPQFAQDRHIEPRPLAGQPVRIAPVDQVYNYVYDKQLP